MARLLFLVVFLICPSGKVWTTPGTYQDTIMNNAGCDSIMTISVVIFSGDSTSITDSSCGPYISNLGNSYPASGTYSETTQNANGCDNQVPVSGANAQSFTPSVSGNYAVVMQNGVCSDTSACYAVTIVGVPEFETIPIALFPNPTTGRVTIDPGRVYNSIEVRVLDAQGKMVQSIKRESVREVHLELGQSAGLYVVQVLTEDGVRVFRVVKVE